MPFREIETIKELKDLAGQEIAIGDWFEVTQERIDQFADATGDHQWIHVDVARCERESPFGSTIAHGYLTLSLLPALMQQTIRINQKFAMGVNYGLNKVRFMSPVKSGARIRPCVTILEVSEIPGGFQNRWQIKIEIEGQDKPACVAESISRLYEGAAK